MCILDIFWITVYVIAGVERNIILRGGSTKCRLGTNWVHSIFFFVFNTLLMLEDKRIFNRVSYNFVFLLQILFLINFYVRVALHVFVVCEQIELLLYIIFMRNALFFNIPIVYNKNFLKLFT